MSKSLRKLDVEKLNHALHNSKKDNSSDDESEKHRKNKRAKSKVADDLAGIARVEVLIEGPSGQVKTLWGEFSGTQPINAQAQVESEILNDFTERGQWAIVFIEITDAADNIIRLDYIDLQNVGYDINIVVSD